MTTAKPAAKRKPAAKPNLRDTTPYRVLGVRGAILYPSDDAQLARLLDGEKIPKAERKMRRAEPGEVVEDLPIRSAKWMLASGWIVEANSNADPFKEEPKKAAPKAKAVDA